MPFYPVYQFEGDYVPDGVHIRVRTGFTDGAIHHATPQDVWNMVNNHLDAIATAALNVAPQVNQWHNPSWRINVLGPPPANALAFDVQAVTNDGGPNNFRLEVYHIEFAQAHYQKEGKARLFARAMDLFKRDSEKRGGGGGSSLSSK